MALSILDITNAQYKTTRAADAQCADLLKRLGYKVRYLAARLAIARSLSLPDPPDLSVNEEEEEFASSIRGQQLFGDGADPAAWMALITQRSGKDDLSRKEFQSLVFAHWRRGAGKRFYKHCAHAQGPRYLHFPTFPEHLLLNIRGEIGGRTN